MIRKFCRLLAIVLVCCLTWALAPGARAANLAVERQIFDFLTQRMGLNSAAASGVLANIEAESGFSLTATAEPASAYASGTTAGLPTCAASAAIRGMITPAWKDSLTISRLSCAPNTPIHITFYGTCRIPLTVLIKRPIIGAFTLKSRPIRRLPAPGGAALLS